MASFLGMELAGVHVSDIRNPQSNFPKAVLTASAFILVSMLFGSLSIASVVPNQEINLISGVIQVFTTFFTAFDLAWCIPILTVLIVVGSIGSIINWLISPAKGLMQAAEHGFLPRFFAKKNQYGVAPRILIMQAMLVSLVCSAFLLVPSINGFYWFLTALSTSMYMLMYVLIFLSALILRLRNPNHSPHSFKVPGGKIGLWVAVLFGLSACCATVAVSFLPPNNIDIGSPLRYSLTIGLGTILAIAPVLFLFWYKSRSKN
jgi:amino acid transporter